ncbi:MAG TPA: CpaF family protein [Bacillota bacterium]|nr:CpaF family protein [Candidatus Fermentithermobacillaceae bacterium]HOA70661.1 CpaF family protein [Bacillota bacterium]HPZ85008.1 CpaF family protein [Bacillota bacterium]HQD85632.1 CpaF family protein [Bacillota bacterium]
MSILERLEQEPYGLLPTHSEAREMSIEEVTQKVREKLLEDYPDLIIEARMSRSKRSEVITLISNVIISSELYVPKLTRQDLAERIAQEICGLGPLDELLDDESITEIMVNGPDEVFVEKHGVLVPTSVKFQNDRHLLDIINRIVQSAGRRVDVSMPYVDARLPDGSRVNAIIPPLALNGPVLTIRRFPQRYTEISQLVEGGTLQPDVASFLKNCVQAKLDIVVSGGSGSGKTTTLNVLANAVPRNQRIIVIEDSAEIRIPDHHVVYLEARPKNMEGRGEVSIRDLLRNALRMRPDRLVIGECRGKETFDLISAMNTGHEGCLSTVHANSAADCLERMVGMALMAEEGVPVDILRSWIAIGVDVVVHMEKTQSGHRVVSGVALVGSQPGQGLTNYPVFDPEYGLTLEFPPWFVEKVGESRCNFLVEGVGP